MLEFQMDGQNTPCIIAQEKDCVGFKPLAAVDAAGALAVFATPVICPKGLLRGLLGPSGRALLVMKHIGTSIFGSGLCA